MPVKNPGLKPCWDNPIIGRRDLGANPIPLGDGLAGFQDGDGYGVGHESRPCRNAVFRGLSFRCLGLGRRRKFPLDHNGEFG
jgi:hypothetical protein